MLRVHGVDTSTPHTSHLTSCTPTHPISQHETKEGDLEDGRTLELQQHGSNGSGKAGDVEFVFKDVSFTVKDKKTKADKVIIQNISATVTPGHVLAIMGPSGSGKTTLINSLTMSAFGGVTRGSVTLGGERMTPRLFQRHCFVVNQQDFHWPFLTCRETLEYAAELFLGHEGKDAQKERVETVLAKMGLESCTDVRVGNEFINGLSGGQKRRLSIGLALIKAPSLIFLDEPTSVSLLSL